MPKLSSTPGSWATCKFGRCWVGQVSVLEQWEVHWPWLMQFKSFVLAALHVSVNVITWIKSWLWFRIQRSLGLYLNLMNYSIRERSISQEMVGVNGRYRWIASADLLMKCRSEVIPP
jgi:hypothetical protein